MAVTGKPTLRARDIYRIEYAKKLKIAYAIRADSNDWGDFAQTHPYWAQQLFEIESIINE